MISNRELVPAAAARAGIGTGREAVAAELLTRARAELPAVTAIGQREQLLAAAWLASLRSPRTRRAYAGDLAGWLAWLAGKGTDVLAATRVHADLWVAAQLEDGAEASSVRRRLSALSSFYRYCAAHDLTGRNPVAGVARPGGGPGLHCHHRLGPGSSAGPAGGCRPGHRRPGAAHRGRDAASAAQRVAG